MEALEALRSNGAGTFQLVLTDVMMPDVDGIELLRHVRQDDSLSSVPVVMMSANEHADTVFECISAGAEDYLLKPLTKKEVQYIWQHVWRRKHQPAMRLQPASAQEQTEEGAVLSISPQPSSLNELEGQLQPSCLPSPIPQPEATISQQHQQQRAHNSDAESSHVSQPHSVQSEVSSPAAVQSNDVIPISRYLSLSNPSTSSGNDFRIFCAVLSFLRPLHAQGISVQSLRPSQLLLHRSGQVTLQPSLPVTVMEAELYISPEQLATGLPSLPSDIFSLGVLFFELMNPIQDQQLRATVLRDVRLRALPPGFVEQHSSHEIAFLMALIHPDASKRPTVAQIISSSLLNMLRASYHPGGQSTGLPAQQQQQQQQQLVVQQHQGCQLLQHQQQHQLYQQAQLQQQVKLQQQAQHDHASVLQPELHQPQQASVDSETLLDFLNIMRQTTLNAVEKAERQLAFLDADISEVNTRTLSLQRPQWTVDAPFPEELQQQSSAPSLLYQLQAPLEQPALELQHPVSRKRQRSWEADASETVTRTSAEQSQADYKRERISQSCQNMDRAFIELESKFFRNRDNLAAHSGTSTADVSDSSHVELPGLAGLSDHLTDFSSDLINFSRYNQLKVKAELNYSDLLTVTDMVCSTAFDRDDEFFATAGVFRRVKIFDFASVLDSGTSIHYPVLEIPSRSKLSSVCWNSYVKSNLICSDYEGVVQLWDVSQQTETMAFEEHAKRVWSVDFSHTDPTRFLSGSDDGTVRLWSIADESAVACIDSKANVCSVQFSPTDSNLMAFGSANYRVYLYDLRQISSPLAVIGGHSKAVSYVRWVGSNQVISASTDNHLKLWDVAEAAISEGNCAPVTSFTGHTNEKNFVGLSVSHDGYIACGSENNAVYCYHKAVPTPICDHNFGTPGHHDDPSEAHHFVSSVCWSRKNNTMISANSMGNIKVLELA
ncbi:hypothetical protein ABBQ32_012949 [Trebouxia sp. C0010 RCD-2024]